MPKEWLDALLVIVPKKVGVWIRWNGMVDWNGGMVISWILLIGFHLLIMTTSEQRPPKFNCQIPFKHG